MKRFTIQKAVLQICLAMLLYYGIMELYYYYFVGIYYLRFGFVNNINVWKYGETKIIFVFILFLSILISRKSEFIYSIFLLFVIFFLVPCLITYSFTDQIRAPLYAIVLLLIVLAAISTQKIKIPNLKSVTLSHGSIIGIAILLSIPMFYSFGLYFNVSNLFLSDVYHTRSYFDENSNLLINYLYNWMVKAIVPLFMVYFLIHKRYYYALVLLALLFYLYIISGNKIVYITSFTMLFFFFFGKGYVQKIKYFSLALIVGLLLLPLLDYFILGDHGLKGIFVMRMLFLPAQLNYYYFDYFDGAPLYFAESNFFNWFVTNPLDKPVGFVIAETYFSAGDMNANNGIVSDGYMNLGFWGIGLNIILVSIIFLFFNSVSPDSRYLGVFFVMVFLFLSAPMLSMIVTNGVWVIALAAWISLRRSNQLGTD
jgi:hypothetical protein